MGPAQPEWPPALYSRIDDHQLHMGCYCIDDWGEDRIFNLYSKAVFASP